MKTQNFILAFCLLAFSINSFSQTTWPARIRVNYTTSTNQFVDNIVIRFSDDPMVTTAESFYWDARSLNCCTFIASLKGNFSFAIQTRPLNFNIDTVKLKVASVNPGDFKFLFTEFQSFTQAKNILLIDTYTGMQQEVKTNPSYSFSITSDATSQGTERFRLIFISEQLVMECPGNITVNQTPNTNGANVSFNLYTPVSKCSDPFFNYSHLPNSFFPIGKTTVNVDAYDLCGNTANCSFIVTVKDIEQPLMSSPAPLYFSTDRGLATFSFIPVAPTVTDNHKLADVQGVRSDGKALDVAYPLGTTAITWKATDSSGNMNSVSQLVTVEDNEAPVITASELELIISDNCSTTLINNPVSITDNSGNVHFTGIRNDGVAISDPYPAGITSILWTASDASGNLSTFTQLVNVKDTIPPTILALNNSLLVANIIGCKRKIQDTSLDPVAFDNCSIASFTNNFNNAGSLRGAELSFGVTNILWTAVDRSGNTTTWLQVVEITLPLDQVDIPDALALASGVDANTIYLGYNPASALSYNALALGGLNYQWTVSPNLAIMGESNTPIVTVTATAVSSDPYTLTLNTSNALGCEVTATKQLNVIDIKCGKNKVLVCTPASKELCVNINSLTAYLLTGNRLGSCNSTQRKAVPIVYSEVKESSFKVFPNPGNGLVNLQFDNYQDTKVEVRITDVLGKLIFSKAMSISNSNETIKFDLQKDAAGVYNVQVITKDGVRSTKIVIAR